MCYAVLCTGSYEQGIVRGAMDEIERRTCVRFVQRTSEANYIDISSNQQG